MAPLATRLLLLALLLPAMAATADAQIVLTGSGTTNTQDFTGFLASGFDPLPSTGRLDSDNFAVVGWSDGNLLFGDTQATASTDYTRGVSSGGVTTGGIYSFAVTALNSGSFGVQPGGSDFAPGTIYVRYFNGTGAAITSLQVAYDVFVRNDQGRSSSFNFSSALGSCAVTDPRTLTFTAIPALDVTSGVAADAAPAFVQNPRSTTLSGFSVTGQTCIYLAFTSADVAGSGSRDEFALDNLAVTPTTSPETAAVTFQTPATGSVAEGATTQATVVLALTNDGGQGGLNTAVTGTLAVQSGTAGASDVSFGTFTFPVGAGDGATATVAITGTDDTLFEGTETATLRFGAVSGATASGTYGLTITDTDPEPALAINELDPDQGATDTGEFVELRGTPSQSLGAFVLVFGDAAGQSYAAVDLDFVATGNTGYATVCSSPSTGNCSTNSSGQLAQIADGAGAVALYLGSAADFPTGTALTASAALRSAVVYGPTRNAPLLAALGQTVQFVEGYADAAPPAPEAVSLARVGTGLFYSQPPTPNAANPATVTVNRTADVGGAGGYRIFSAPVVKPGGTSRFNVADLAAINLVQRVAGGTDEGGTYGPQYPDAPGPNLFLGYDGTAYQPAATTADDLTPGAGFFWRLYNQTIAPTSPAPYGPGTSQSYAFGNPLFQLALTGVPLDNAPAATPYAVPMLQNASGFYLLGNPFAYPLYLGGVTTSAGTLQTTFQTFDGITYQPRTASVSTPAAGDAVAPWQGFFAESADLTGAGAFDVRYDARRVAPTAYATDLVGRPAAEGVLALRLDGRTAAGIDVADRAALVRLVAGAATGWDPDDASKLTPPAGPYALVAPVGTRGGAPYRQAVLALPLGAAAGVYPLAFTATDAGTFTLRADLDDLPAGWSATLRDVTMGVLADLAAGYTFTSDATDWTDRFALVLRSDAATAGDDAPGTAMSLSAPRPNPASGRAVLTLRLAAPEHVTATVVDALGRTVQTVFEGALSAGQSQDLTVDAPRLAPGVYVVRVTGETFAATRRLVVAH